MRPSIGIDLGTTNSAVATAASGQVQIIERETGHRLLPSLVGIDERGGRVVGEEARVMAETQPERVAYATKRFIGRRWTPELAQKSRHLYPYQLVAGPQSDVRIRLGQQTLPIAQVSGMLLAELRADAEDFFSEQVTDAVITVPAAFTDAQRQATREAAEIAGLRVLRLINEPTAAAIAYGLQNNFRGTTAVFDLGGGTFDVSVLRIHDGVFEVLATEGDQHFGGDDFDNALVEWLLSHVQESAARDRLTNERRGVQQLKRLAERAKCEISSVEQTRLSALVLPDGRGGGIPIETMLTREFFEKLVRPKTEYALSIVERALMVANVTAKEVDAVLLVGGMTRVPLLRQLVAKHFGKEPDFRVDPDEAVAIGAALHAKELAEKEGRTLLLDVVGSSLGVQMAGGVVKQIIPRNTMLPCSITEVFYPGRDGQEVARVPVLQGESLRADENTKLGELMVDGLSASLRKQHKLDVTFSLDVDGTLSVSAEDKLFGVSKSVTLDARTSLTQSEAAALAQKERAHRATQPKLPPEERKANRRSRGALHRELVVVRRVLHELQTMELSAVSDDSVELQSVLAAAVVEAEEALRSAPREGVNAMTAKLKGLLLDAG